MLRRSTAPPWRRPRFLVPAGVLVAAAVAVPLVLTVSGPGVRVDGLTDGALLGKDALAALRVTVTPDGADAGEVRLRLDGRPLPGSRDGGALVWRPGTLPDGPHQLTVTVPGGFPAGDTTATRRFTVDTTPPTLAVDAPASVDSLRAKVTVTGRVSGGDTVTAGGRTVDVRDGTFTLSFDTPPAGVPVVATDKAGNRATDEVTVPVHHPMMRGVHMTALAWSYAGLRDPVLQLAREHRINTVELDIKDEDGVVGYATAVPMAAQVGAVGRIYDARKAIDELHGLGVRVVGRIVAFRDPKLATWAWQHGHHDWVVQDPSGKPWASSYGSISFTNFAAPAVRQYNIDLATEAAKLGFDDIMYDYVRRPDGKLAQMRFPGLTTTPEQGVASFVAATRGPVLAAGAYLGAAVFGVAATRPQEIAQNIPMLARYVDYVSPMVYPSHWGPGEYGVANPNAQPYDIVNRSLKDFQAKVKGTDAQVFPWLQDFSLGVSYGVPQVQAQIRAAHDDGIDGFILWDAGCSYHGDALAPIRS